MFHALHRPVKAEFGGFAVGCEVQGAGRALGDPCRFKIVCNDFAWGAKFLAGYSAQAPGLVLFSGG